MRSIAVIGSGPAGCTVATLLKRQGHNVVLFSDGRTTELFVGESLIPAIIPVLRELGIEEKVKEFSVHKPGATVWVHPDLMAEASFAGGMNTLPTYAYNTNRRHFDALLLETAKEAGVPIVEMRAGIQVRNGRVSLNEESLAATSAFFNGQPDFFIDASGRKRMFSNAMKLPERKGKRMDTALFAHVKELEFRENYGDIHMHLATRGWCWRIPLPDRTSVGIVINRDTIETFGKTSEEQFDRYIQEDPKISPFFTNVERISSVQKYSNYQLQTLEITGENWALVGDAAGFLDPVFSSGLYFSMKYASKLAATFDATTANDLSSYQKSWHREISSWRKMIELWYNGRLFTNFKMGNDRLSTFMGKRIGKHAIRHFTAIFTGEAVLNRYSMWLLRFMTGPLLNFMYFFRMHRYKVKDLEL